MGSNAAFSLLRRPLLRMVAFGIALGLTFSVNAQQLTSKQLDSAAGQYAEKMKLTKPLHDSLKFNDGARGFDAWVYPEQPANGPEQFKTMGDRELHLAYCHADAIVLGTAKASVPYLDSAKNMIITVTNFAIGDVIKPDGHVHAGSGIKVIRMGGQVKDGADILRVGVPDRPEYKHGNQYIVFLTKSKIGSSVYYGDPLQTTWVANGLLVPSNTFNSGMQRGESYVNLKNRLNNHRLKPVG